MKGMKLVLPAILLAFLALSLACPSSFGDDQGKHGFYVPRAKEEIYGTWVNTTEYHGGTGHSQRIEMHDWGYWQMYSKETDEFYVEGTYILVDRWTDAEGNIWYKDFVRGRNELYPLFELDKVSQNGTVWEYVVGYEDFPKGDNMNSKNPYYRIYYRQQ